MDAAWDIVCFASVDWDSHWQRPQAVLSSLAEHGARVVWIDNLGLRRPRVADARRVARRLRLQVAPAQRERSPLFARESPIVLPSQQLAPVRSMATRSIMRRLARHHIGRDGRPVVVWTYLPSPTIHSVARELDADALVYDWCDDACERLLSRSARVRRRVSNWENAMVRRADVVFVASGELSQRHGVDDRRVIVVPHGVSDEHSRPGVVSVEIARLPRPRLVFVGSISEWTDLDLLGRIAAAKPEWSLVLVGPARVRVDELARLPNVLVIGSRPQAEIAGILAACDVGLVPYKASVAMSAASPLKVHEYLAHGLPVVSIDIPALHGFAPHVEFASGAEGFIAAIERALERGRDASAAARNSSWSERVEEMVGLVAGALSSGRVDR
jgi:glycosyltransferase involved in cell wall biosynthesis